MDQTLKRTELYQWHVDQGARLVPFAGWEMPVQYPTGPIEEHNITRRSAGLFDINHMGQITITGPEAEAYLNNLVTADVSKMTEYRANYGLMCYENGGVVDDVFIYRLPNRWFVVVNADNLEKDWQWMTDHSDGYDVTLTNVSSETYMIALQGPKAMEILQRLVHVDLLKFRRFTAMETDVDDIPAIVGRTGYTGEDGVELFFPPEKALEMWKSILHNAHTAGIEANAIGLAARDSLRFEPGFSLYGHEITADITPLEANLGWACKFQSDFIGKTALLKQKETGLSKKLIAFELTKKGVPRQGYAVTNSAGETIGEVVTGLYAPTVNKYCGHAFVPPEYAKVGTELNVLIRNKPKAAVVSKRPFYKPSY